MIIANRDLASPELWLNSLERSRRRRMLAAQARKELAPKKHVATAMATAMIAGQGAPLAMASGVRDDSAGESSATRTIQIKEGGLPLKLGSEGELVEQIQRALGVPADGVYGPATETAVRKFQLAAGLLVDGVIGPQTWAALFSTAKSGKSAPAPSASASAAAERSAPVDDVPTETKREIAGQLAAAGERLAETQGVEPVSRRVAAETPAPGNQELRREAASPTPAPAPAPRTAPVNDVTGDCSSSSLAMPVRGTPTSEFGPRWGRHHDGIDIAAPTGTAIRAAACGRVSFRGQQSGYGNIVCITHNSALTTCYAHMSAFAVGSGARVRTGQVIGYVGCTGSCTGPHLHFETRVNGRPQNPRNYLGGQPMPSSTRRSITPRATRATARKPANAMTVRRSAVSSTATGGGDAWRDAPPRATIAVEPQPAAEPEDTATTVEVEAPTPVEPAPVEPTPVEAAPVEAAPAPVEAAPVEAAPVAPAPVEAAPAPVEAAPVEAAPVEAAPVEAAPVAPAPVEAAPAPVEAAPVEPAPAPVEAAPAPAPVAPAPAPAPVEAAPVEAAPVQPAPEEAAPAPAEPAPAPVEAPAAEAPAAPAEPPAPVEAPAPAAPAPATPAP